MMSRIVVVVLLCACGTAAGDYPHVFHHFAFEEVDAVTHLPVLHPNGIIEPGEAALIRLSISFDPPAGAIIEDPWAVHALRSSMFVLLSGVVPAEGTWHDLRVAPGWDANGRHAAGQATMNGTSVVGIMPAQHFEDADTSNPVVDVWQGIWVPDDYSERTVRFGSWCNSFPLQACSALWAVDRNAPGTHTWWWTWTFESSVDIPISPNLPVCYGDCDGNGALNIDDFLCFVNEFAAAHSLPPSQQITHYANCDGSTTEPVLTIDDFLCFINEFALGCP